MIEFKVEYLADKSAMAISATVGEHSGTICFEISNDFSSFTKALELSLNQLINAPRSRIVHDDPLSKIIEANEK
jgi:hypothetical protein